MDTNASSEVVPGNVIAPAPTVPEGPAAVLRGTARGLEVVMDGGASTDAITAAVMKRLDEAPGFFRGSDVRIRVENGPLPVGTLAKLDDIAGRFELRIVEVTAAKRAPDVKAPALDRDAVPEANLAAGSAPSTPALDAEAAPKTRAEASPAPVVAMPADPVKLDEPAAPAQVAATPVAVAVAVADAVADADAAVATAAAPAFRTRVVVGPVRSGVILEHVGHLIIFGDVNPGAEVRASGNIVVLGRLKGTAHAGIGHDVGFIMALKLEPQQLRIGRKVARAADSDKGASDPEIAYLTGDHVVVERYLGKLPKNLATSL